MFGLASSVAVLAAASAEAGLTPQQALTTSLTAESLLFAAFGVSYSLATTTVDRGRSAFFTKGWFGWLIVVVIAAIAASGVSAWHAVFDCDWPDDTGEYLQKYGLLAAIVMQPIFAAIVNWEARKT